MRCCVARSQMELKFNMIFFWFQVKNQFVEHAFEVSSFLFFLVPMTIICVLYILIGIKLRKSKLLYGKKTKSSDSHRQISGQTRVIRMLSEFAQYVNNIVLLINVFFFYSCCCCHFLLVLGTISCTENYGNLWENYAKVHYD